MGVPTPPPGSTPGPEYDFPGRLRRGAPLRRDPAREPDGDGVCVPRGTPGAPHAPSSARCRRTTRRSTRPTSTSSTSSTASPGRRRSSATGSSSPARVSIQRPWWRIPRDGTRPGSAWRKAARAWDYRGDRRRGLDRRHPHRTSRRPPALRGGGRRALPRHPRGGAPAGEGDGRGRRPRRHGVDPPGPRAGWRRSARRLRAAPPASRFARTPTGSKVVRASGHPRRWNTGRWRWCEGPGTGPGSKSTRTSR